MLRPDWRAARQTGAIRILIGVTAVLSALLLGDLAHRLDVEAFASARWNVNLDRSYIEIVGYGLVLTALLLLLASTRRTRPVYAAWAATLTVVVMDDAFEWHERGGLWLDERWSVPAFAGLRSRDVGELLTWGALGVFVVVAVTTAHQRSSAAARRDSWRFCALIVVLVVFAVGVDMAHAVLVSASSALWLDRLTGWIEAAGELTAMAAITAYALHVRRVTGPGDGTHVLPRARQPLGRDSKPAPRS